MLHGTPMLNPISAAWNTVARFDEYGAAQRAVDRLSDDGFPVGKLDIVGSDLRLIERVTGRLTTARATGAGAVSGLWAGLLIGALLALFTTGHAGSPCSWSRPASAPCGARSSRSRPTPRPAASVTSAPSAAWPPPAMT